MKHIHMDEFAKLESPLHAMDPRVNHPVYFHLRNSDKTPVFGCGGYFLGACTADLPNTGRLCAASAYMGHSFCRSTDIIVSFHHPWGYGLECRFAYHKDFCHLTGFGKGPDAVVARIGICIGDCDIDVHDQVQ